MERYAEMRKENRGVMATGRASAARIIAKRDASCCVALRLDTPLLCHYIRNERMTFAAKSTDIVGLRLERRVVLLCLEPHRVLAGLVKCKNP